MQPSFLLEMARARGRISPSKAEPGNEAYSSRGFIGTGVDARRMRELTPAAEHQRILDRWTEQPGRIAGFWILHESYAGQRNGDKPGEFQFRAGVILFPLVNRRDYCIYCSGKSKREGDRELRNVDLHALPRSAQQRALPRGEPECHWHHLGNVEADRSDRMHREQRNLPHEPAAVIASDLPTNSTISLSVIVHSSDREVLPGSVAHRWPSRIGRRRAARTPPRGRLGPTDNHYIIILPLLHIGQ